MPSSPYITLDESLWPLLTVRIIGEPSTPQMAEYLERLGGYVERGEKFVLLYDARRTTATGPAEQRQMQAAWIGRHEARLREVMLGTAFLFTSPMVRLSVGVVLHLKPPPIPYFMTGQLEAAVAWACERLEVGGLVQEAGRLRTHHGLCAPAPRMG